MFLSALLLGAALVPGPGPGPGPRPSSAHAPRTALVLLLTVDQFRPDYLERYNDQWTGGLRRLYDESVVFRDGRQDHAITETAPGHSTLLSGRRPARTGILTNLKGVPDSSAPLLEVPGPGASPRRFIGSTLADWMRARDSATRVLSVSRKDRGAIAPIGRALGGVYWYEAGKFTTSRYYADTLPHWVREFNDRHGPERLAGTTWSLLLPESAYAEPDSEPYENDGRDFTFPHSLPGAPAALTQVMKNYPWMDSLTLDLALDGVAATGLGRRDSPDLLSVSLSTTDAIGHNFGPDSRELHDQLLRLDHWLGWFLDSLAVLVPREQTIIVLTSDHGVQSFVEHTREEGRPAARIWFGALARRTEGMLEDRYHQRFFLDFDYGILSGDTVAMHALGIPVDSLAGALAGQMRRAEGVKRVFTPRSLAAAPAGDREARLWRNQIPGRHAWLAAGVLQPGFTWQGTAGWTNHATTNELDIRVPILFWRAGLRHAVIDRAVPTVDIGPTLAALLDLTPTEPVEGRPLPEVVRPRP
ncbi:MAG: alkaline phosphatase family protein [Gemmatimonadales bacterium]